MIGAEASRAWSRSEPKRLSGVDVTNGWRAGIAPSKIFEPGVRLRPWHRRFVRTLMGPLAQTERCARLISSCSIPIHITDTGNRKSTFFAYFEPLAHYTTAYLRILESRLSHAQTQHPTIVYLSLAITADPRFTATETKYMLK